MLMLPLMLLLMDYAIDAVYVDKDADVAAAAAAADAVDDADAPAANANAAANAAAAAEVCRMPGDVQNVPISCLMFLVSLLLSHDHCLMSPVS